MKLCVMHYSKYWSFPATEELIIHNRHSFHYAFICNATGLSALLKELLYLHEVYAVCVHLKRTVVIQKFLLRISILYCQSLGHRHEICIDKSLGSLLEYSLIHVENNVNQSLKFQA